MPVMLAECLEGLDIQPGKNYVDVTFGGGGHSKEILKLVGDGKLYAFDQDADAKAEAEKLPSDSFQLIEANFRYLKKYLKLYGGTPVNGLLADLGVSSHQFDTEDRGFSIRGDAALDMRMNQSYDVSAATVINEYEEEKLVHIFKFYGELRSAKGLAKAICNTRASAPIESTGELMSLLKPFAPKFKDHKFYAQVFQALRIEVNDELEALKDMLEQACEVLEPGGKLVVMSYHSLEDRLVKNFMKFGNFEGTPEKDFYGNLLRPMKPVGKPVTAQEEELARNNRARSARLRVAVKL